MLARFLTASRFTWFAEGTREAYAKDYRLFFSFLWQRRKYWQEADPDDLDLYQGYYQGKRLDPGHRIISVDAKPSIQARSRCMTNPRRTYGT